MRLILLDIIHGLFLGFVRRAGWQTSDQLLEAMMPRVLVRLFEHSGHLWFPTAPAAFCVRACLYFVRLFSVGA